MKTLKLTNAKLMSYEKGNNSVNGNPSYHASFSNGSEVVTGKTASNASCGYSLTNFSDGRPCDATYYITRSGRVIIDEIKEAI